MISQLSGHILEKMPPHLILDVHGVGYEIIVPMSTFYDLPPVGSLICILTHFLIREDAHQLYGFLTSPERKLFRYLIKINGVGPKLGLAILSSITPKEFVDTILNNNLDALIRLPGIGKKTAERLIIEMRDKLNDWYEDDVMTLEDSAHKTSLAPSKGQSIDEAIYALISLGYKQSDASKAVARTGLSAESACEDIIRAALKLLAMA